MKVRLKVLLTPDEDGMFCASVPVIPGCFSAGRTVKEAMENIREALELHLDILDEEIERSEGALVQEVVL